MPIPARSKLRFQIAPVARPERFAIVPGVLRVVLLGRTGDDQSKRATDDDREGVLTNLHITSEKRLSANDAFRTHRWRIAHSLPLTPVPTTVRRIALRDIYCLLRSSSL